MTHCPTIIIVRYTRATADSETAKTVVVRVSLRNRLYGPPAERRDPMADRGQGTKRFLGYGKIRFGFRTVPDGKHLARLGAADRQYAAYGNRPLNVNVEKRTHSLPPV